MPEDDFEGSSGAEFTGGATTNPRTNVVRKSHLEPGCSRSPEPGSVPEGESRIREHPEGDGETYQGVGFTGSCVGEASLPRLAGASPAAGAQSDTSYEQEPAASEANLPTLYCLSCDSKLIFLPSRRVWCPRCKTFSEVRGGSSIPTIAAVIGVVLLLVVTLFYVQGSFDHLLYSIGLNWETCWLGDREILCRDTSGASESIENGVRSWFR